MIFKPRSRDFWAGVLLFGVTLIAYLPALKGGFIWDDDGYVTRQSFRTLHGLWRIWFDVGATEGYYPLMHTAFWVEHRLWGDAPLGYHLVNVLLHATAACLFGLVLQRVGRIVPNTPLGVGPTETPSSTSESGVLGTVRPTFSAPFLAAFLFALHPVCVESVAWVSEQKNVLSTVFYLLAALTYLRFDAGRKRSLYFLALGLFILALLSKTVTATLPAGLLLVFWWRRGRLSWKDDVRPLVPWFAVGAFAGLFSGWVERVYFGAEGGAFDLSLLQRVLLAGRIIWFYLGKLVWPAHLIFIYPHWQIDAGAGWQYLLPFAALAMAAALYLFRQRARGLFVAYLFFVGTLFPTMGFFNIYGFVFSYVADHWQYLPSLGVFAFVAGAWGLWRKAEYAKSGNRKIGKSENISAGSRFPDWQTVAFARYPLFRFLPFLVLTTLATLTWRQCGLYNDMETFYTQTIAKNPACWLGHNNLGNLLRRQGRVPEAIAHFEEALRLNPGLADAHNNLGIALAELGHAPEALAEFKRAVALKPDFTKAHTNLSNALRMDGRLPEAIAEGEEAVRLTPDYAGAQDNLGVALADAGRLPEAIVHYREAVRIDPDFPEAHYSLGVALAETGQVPPAIGEFEAAIRLKPNYADAHYNLGQILRSLGREREGMAELQEAERLKADR